MFGRKPKDEKTPVAIPGLDEEETPMAPVNPEASVVHVKASISEPEPTEEQIHEELAEAIAETGDSVVALAEALADDVPPNAEPLTGVVMPLEMEAAIRRYQAGLVQGLSPDSAFFESGLHDELKKF
jgi:hypothetical protein